ncbi:hypothetical protein EVAR_7180_1 [Eumeta japonica]|uniref:Uncharacterized protein n=1 Tax=Eumeta variegata TaxID=151549 RepID=A0A4C1U6G1_EUMVA|nr:hypothetical protein EVAR_7180_1 [Eumeta japonica]
MPNGGPRLVLKPVLKSKAEQGVDPTTEPELTSRIEGCALVFTAGHFRGTSPASAATPAFEDTTNKEL